MRRKLPGRPNLEHLRTQAKTLLTKLRAGDTQAAGTFIAFLPEASALQPDEVCARGFRLADAQAAIARKTGFAAWPGLARHVDRLRNMEGTWSFRSLEIDGQTLPSAMLRESRMLIDGDRFRMESPEATYEGIFTIDVECEPQRIDIDFVEGPEAGNRCEGLFQLDGDQLTFCLGLVGSSRPERFATAPGTGHVLEVLVRADSGRPAGVEGGKLPFVLSVPVAVVETEDFEAVMTPTLERLQGEWVPLELITSGKPLQASYLPYGSRTQTGTETKVVFGGQTMVHARVRFHETAMPVEVDYMSLEGKSLGTMAYGIFRWDGDEAVFCMARTGELRPTDFLSEKGSGRTLSRWKRKDSRLLRTTLGR